MRAALIASGLLLAVGCGKREPPPSLPAAEPRAGQAEEEIPAPTKPTPAFVPVTAQGCQPVYRLVEGTCVHRRYEAADEGALSSAIALYKQGAAPPMLAAAKVAPEPEPESDDKRPDPGSLTRKKADAAHNAKERRLAELDAMLALANEKLAKRDAESKAKQVANAPRKEREQPGNGAKESPEQFARGMNAGSNSGTGAAAPAASGDSESARMSELSRVTSQLSGDQIKAISEELSKSGFNPGSMDALLKEAQGKPGMQ